MIAVESTQKSQKKWEENGHEVEREMAAVTQRWPCAPGCRLLFLFLSASLPPCLPARLISRRVGLLHNLLKDGVVLFSRPGIFTVCVCLCV